MPKYILSPANNEEFAAPKVEHLKGKTLIRIDREHNELRFFAKDGSEYRMYHEQDCCETVYIDDINGDLDDLVGSPILLAEEVSNDDFISEYAKTEDASESYTWTFYRFATVKGYVDIRWYGGSNGYYSENVDFERVK